MSHTSTHRAGQSAHSNDVSATADHVTSPTTAAITAVMEDRCDSKDEWGRETSDLWRNCAAYRKDRRLTKGRGVTKAPRIPDTILDAIRRLEVDFGRAVSALGVQPEHLRNALNSRDVSCKEEANTDGYRGADAKGAIVESLLGSEIGCQNQSLDADADFRTVRGEDAKLRLHLAILDYYEQHAEFPSKSYLRKQYRIASATCHKYWPTPSELGIDDASPEVAAPPPIVPMPQQAVVSRDLVMKISALVFSDEFVEGTYDDAGTPRCDRVENDDKGLRLFVHAWRKQEHVVEKIIRLAGELELTA